ncbi:hypothetical protein BZK31_28560 [Pseudomonas floridensis]|uniref:Uncharacterized protein n=1 Tax=Pseudomonas floridensis TaxID=1958950 RepID=A0A1X0MJ09_9PSED|nr:hypothetical protein [Pseudomonas floridensis]ORC46889.1 hypothetical protein BZK31_28560 [Pseudomonas floridensis]
MARFIWGDLPQVTIKTPPARVDIKKPAVQISQVLRDVGENALALNSFEMEKRKMKPLFKDFNPAQITPEELAKAGMMLYKFGFIDNHTAELMSRAGNEFDAKGKVLNPDKEINALEFFASRIVEMKEKSAWGDPYAKLLVPDYIRAIHIIQNLEAFARSGDSPDMLRIKALEKQGRSARTPSAWG